MTGSEMYNIIKKNKGMGGSKPRAYCNMKGGAWCCAYVCYGFNQAGQKSLFYGGKKVTYCPTAITWCKANLAEIPLYLAMPCDIIFFDWQPNGTPDHIGFVKNRINTAEIETHEGNTSGGIVAEKTRKVGARCKMWVFRPHFAPTGLKEKKLAEDGIFGYNTIYMSQVFLKKKGYYKGSLDGILGKATVKAVQAWAGTPQDGSFGKKTALAVQKKVGTKADGAFGKNSVLAYQKYLNKQLFPKSTQTTNAQKIVNMANELAWAYGTSSSKWDYKKGNPTAKCKSAMKSYGYTARAKMSSCIYAVNTVVRKTGINKSFCAGHGYKKPYPKTEAGFNTVLSGKSIPSGFLKAGDIVRYKKTSKDEHSLIYMGNGRVAEARHYHRFFNIYKDEKRYNGSNVKKSTLQVLRAKE